MAFHIEQVTANVTAMDGELPLSTAQLDKLVDLIAKRLEDKGRDKALSHEASAIQRHVAPPLRIGD